MNEDNKNIFNGDNSTQELSVSQISNALKRTVEDSFSYVRVRGEISGFKRAVSGHLYMDLKDENSLINSVCWKGNAGKLSIQPQDGMEVIVTGKITTYAPRSNYQLVISNLEVAGVGALLKILEDRKIKLQAEGLFDASLKRPLPILPRRIGVVTSPTGAVIRDIIHRLEDRFPLSVYVYPCRVQGDGSAEEIAKGIKFFNNPTGTVPKVDLIIVARGGGSVEDLWAFNEEIVARAVFDSTIPLISAVGHETDTTLIDFVSDRRAPTPTAAAEMAVPVLTEVQNHIDRQSLQMNTILMGLIKQQTLELNVLAGKLPDAHAIVNSKSQRLDDLQMRLAMAGKNCLLHTNNNLQMTAQKLITPNAYIAKLDANFNHTVANFKNISVRYLELKQHAINKVEGLLESYSFKKTLQRGFALVRNDNGTVIKDTASAKQSGTVKITFSDGDIDAEIY